jgi:hypothetical protein
MTAICSRQVQQEAATAKSPMQANGRTVMTVAKQRPLKKKAVMEFGRWRNGIVIFSNEEKAFLQGVYQ